MFFFTDPPPTELYTLSLHDALPISAVRMLPPSPRCLYQRCHSRAASSQGPRNQADVMQAATGNRAKRWWASEVNCRQSDWRSEEHTSELQSQSNLVCRLLLEKKTNT